MIQTNSKQGYHIMSGNGKLNQVNDYILKDEEREYSIPLQKKDYLPDSINIEGYCFMHFYNNAIAKSKIQFNTNDIFSLEINPDQQVKIIDNRDESARNIHPRVVSTALVNVSKSARKDIKLHNMCIVSPDSLDTYFGLKVKCKISSIDFLMMPEISSYMNKEDIDIAKKHTEIFMEHVYHMNPNYCDRLNVLYHFENNNELMTSTIEFDDSEYENFCFPQYPNDLGNIVELSKKIRSNKVNSIDMRELLWMRRYEDFESINKKNGSFSPLPEYIALVKFEAVHSVR